MFKPGLSFMLTALLLTGCEEGNRVKDAGSALSRATTDFAAGLGSGVDKGLEVSVELSEKTTALGMTSTVGKKLGIDHKGITVYLLASQPVKTQLVAKAMNAENEEIGRSVVEADFAADDAKYVTFNFDDEVDIQLAEKYIIDSKPLPVEKKAADVLASEDAKTVPEEDAKTVPTE
jgi:hypothetical protein